MIEGVPQVNYHRNGIGGESFYAVNFMWIEDGEPRAMFAVVFPPPAIETGPDEGEADWSSLAEGRWTHCPRVAVFDAELLPGAVFTENSWRGDAFAPALYAAIIEHQASRLA